MHFCQLLNVFICLSKGEPNPTERRRGKGVGFELWTYRLTACPTILPTQLSQGKSYLFLYMYMFEQRLLFKQNYFAFFIKKLKLLIQKLDTWKPFVFDDIFQAVRCVNIHHNQNKQHLQYVANPSLSIVDIVASSLFRYPEKLSRKFQINVFQLKYQ